MAKVVDIGEGKGGRKRPKHSTLPPRPRGRPPKYCPEVHALLVEAAGLGLFRKLQAMYAGIGERTLEEWLEDGHARPDTSPYADLARHLESAEAERAMRAAKAVDSSARGWQASAWYLERKYPSQYGRRVQEIHGKDGAELTFRVEWPSAKKDEGGAE